ncbi:phage holin family protein [Parapedomonas caeni]
MASFLIRIVLIVSGLWIATHLVPGVSLDAPMTFVWAALLLVVVNAIVKPVAIILTLPITVVTFGLFLLAINAAMFGLVAWLLDGFQVAGFGSALLGALVVGLVSMVGSWLIDSDLKERRYVKRGQW